MEADPSPLRVFSMCHDSRVCVGEITDSFVRQSRRASSVHDYRLTISFVVSNLSTTAYLGQTEVLYFLPEIVGVSLNRCQGGKLCPLLGRPFDQMIS